uniref:MULE transposase domain-containing protein n=1 Tax=Lactuca sativa TaxID=4236 RepID=A0A9R1V8V5_LACSA|nr:hypothetical protein LSAT_V11C600323530 [Lactuca sativa]
MRCIIWWGKSLHDVEFFEDEYSGSKESVSEGPWSEGSRSEGNMTNDESKDEDFFVDLENIVDDVDWVQKTTKEASGSGVDFTKGEDLEVIDPKSFESPIVGEDNNRERMLRDIRNAKSCSEVVVHPKAYTLGQKFKTKKDVKEYINKHVVETKRDLHFEKNDITRIRAKCRGVVPDMSGGPWTKSRTGFKDKTINMKEGKCPWVVLVFRPKETDDWEVNTLVSEHRCVQSRTIKACNYKYIAKHIVKQIESNPTIPVNALQEDLIQKFEMNMSRMKVHRAKALAQKHVFGDFQKQYAILRGYGLELMERNPGTNVKIDCHTEPNLNSDTRMFRRIYICLGALKEGFKVNLRDFIGLDGTFMKGPYPGQILTAVGVDSHNGIYPLAKVLNGVRRGVAARSSLKLNEPWRAMAHASRHGATFRTLPLAYALVENETANSWTWFLEQLGDDLELYANSNFTFISDRQKGIILAIAKLFPQAKRRFCLRHMFENMKRQWKDKELKNLVWACETATTIPPAHWARSHFSGRAHTNILLNNLCEVLNGKIQGGRDKPIIYCLEYIREYLMKRICNVQREIYRCHGPLTPTATSLLDQMKRQAQKHMCIFNWVKTDGFEP